MVCLECGMEMRKDDVDFRFEGCKNVYWLCDFCPTSCIEQVRFNHSFKQIWHTEKEDGTVIDYEIVNKIDRG